MQAYLGFAQTLVLVVEHIRKYRRGRDKEAKDSAQYPCKECENSLGIRENWIGVKLQRLRASQSGMLHELPG